MFVGLRKSLDRPLLLVLFHQFGFSSPDGICLAHQHGVLGSAKVLERINRVGRELTVGIEVVLVEAAIVDFRFDGPGQIESPNACRKVRRKSATRSGHARMSNGSTAPSNAGAMNARRSENLYPIW